MSAHKPLVVTISIAKAVITVKLIVSAKCLFTSRAASQYLKQSLLSVRSAQDELKPEKKKLLTVKKLIHQRCFELLCDESAIHCFVCCFFFFCFVGFATLWNRVGGYEYSVLIHMLFIFSISAFCRYRTRELLIRCTLVLSNVPLFVEEAQVEI